MTEQSPTYDRASTSELRHPTRQHCLADHAQRYRNEAGVSVEKLALRIAERYAAMVPPAHRIGGIAYEGDDTDTEAYVGWRVRMTKRLERWLSGEVPLQADLEDAWLAALPEPYRRRCIHDLCARQGMLPVAVPDGAVTAEDLGEVIREAGEELAAAAPIYSDGRITAEDLPYLDEAIRHGEQSASASLSHVAMMKVKRRELAAAAAGAPYIRPVESAT